MSAAAEPADDLALEVAGLSKVYERRDPRWRRFLLPWSSVTTGRADDDDDDVDDDDDDDDVYIAEPEEHGTTWVLRDVSFSVHRGEIIGVVGGDGSGADTLTRVLAGLSPPSEGRVVIRGRLGPPPAVVGMLGAQQQVARRAVLDIARVMGAPVGMARERRDEILDFARIKDPKQRMSEMPTEALTRLMLSAVLHLEPDVLLSDRGFTNGRDVRFQQSYVDRLLRERAERGMTVLTNTKPGTFAAGFVDRVLWLDGGQVRAFGPAEETFAAFLEAQAADDEDGGEAKDEPRAALDRVQLVDRAGHVAKTIAPHDDARVQADVAVEPHTVIACALQLRRAGGDEVETEGRWRLEEAGRHRVHCTIPAAWLQGEDYEATLTVTTDELHGIRRTARQRLELVLQEATGDDRRPLDEVAQWRLEELGPVR